MSNSPLLQRMFQDPEANICYSLKSLSMPEEIIDLNAIAANHRPLNVSLASTKVTFNQVHSILYGNPLSKLINQYRGKYIDKKVDRSYSHTHIFEQMFLF
jgi:hypothetical protein